MNSMFKKLKREYGKWGLNLNMSKTEYLKLGNDEEDSVEIRTTKSCKGYKYLRSIISIESTMKRARKKR